MLRKVRSNLLLAFGFSASQLNLKNIIMKFNFNHFTAFILLLFIEVLLTQTTGFIRHTFGDFLAVIGVYCFVKSFFNIAPIKLGFGVLIFSFTIELLQATSFLAALGFGNNKTVNIIFGNTFSVGDLVAYTLGIITIIVIDTIELAKLKTFLNI